MKLVVRGVNLRDDIFFSFFGNSSVLEIRKSDKTTSFCFGIAKSALDAAIQACIVFDICHLLFALRIQ